MMIKWDDSRRERLTRQEVCGTHCDDSGSSGTPWVNGVSAIGPMTGQRTPIRSSSPAHLLLLALPCKVREIHVVERIWTTDFRLDDAVLRDASYRR